VKAIMENNKFYLVDEFGKKQEYEILCAYKLISNNKNYIIYKDNTYSDNKLNVYAAIYNNGNLESLTLDEEWDEVERRMESLKNNGYI
jgi:uncharacterized protein YrzB (UPF0473 family)